MQILQNSGVIPLDGRDPLREEDQYREMFLTDPSVQHFQLAASLRKRELQLLTMAIAFEVMDKLLADNTKKKGTSRKKTQAMRSGQ